MWPQMYMSDSIWNEEHWLEEADKGKRLCYTRTGNATLLSKSADRTLLETGFCCRLQRLALKSLCGFNCLHRAQSHMACPCASLLSPPHFNILLSSEHNTKSLLIHMIKSLLYYYKSDSCSFWESKSAQHKHCLNGSVWLTSGRWGEFL